MNTETESNSDTNWTKKIHTAKGVIALAHVVRKDFFDYRYYLSIYTGCETINLKYDLRTLASLLTHAGNNGLTVVMHDAKKHLLKLSTLVKIFPEFNLYDTYIAEKVIQLGLQPDEEKLDFDWLHFKYLDKNIQTITSKGVFQLWQAQVKKLWAKGLAKHCCQIEFPFIFPNAQIEATGVLVDGEVLERKKVACEKELRDIIKLAREMGLPLTGEKEGDALTVKYFIDKGFKNLKGRYLNEISDWLSDKLEEKPMLKQYTKLKQNKSILDNVKAGLNHPEHIQLGSTTGRNSCKNPSITGLSRSNKPIVVPQHGNIFIEFDYSQMELCVLACESNDTKLIEDLHNGDVFNGLIQDLYSNLQTNTYEFNNKRDEVKDCIYALIYSDKARKVNEYYSTEKEKIQWAFVKKYPNLIQYADQQVAGPDTEILMRSGLKRNIPHEINEWKLNNIKVNTPIQGSATCVFKLAVIAIYDYLKSFDARIALIIHDSVLLELLPKDQASIEPQVKELMVKAFQEYYPMLTPTIKINNKATHCWNKDGLVSF